MILVGLGVFFAAFAVSFYSEIASDWMFYFSGVICCIGCLLYAIKAIMSYKEETSDKNGAAKNTARWTIRLCASVFGMAGLALFCAIAESTADFFGYYFLPIVTIPAEFILKGLSAYWGLSLICFLFWRYVEDHQHNHAKA